MNKLDRYMTNPANFEQIAKDWAQVFNTHLAANRVDMLTSELINRNIIQILYMLADTILTPELLHDRSQGSMDSAKSSSYPHIAHSQPSLTPTIPSLLTQSSGGNYETINL